MVSSRVCLAARLASTTVSLLAALSLPHPGLAQAAKPAASGGKPADNRAKPPFEITEDRPRCRNYDPKRQALFGTTHLHTGLSFDASIRFVDYANGNEAGRVLPASAHVSCMRQSTPTLSPTAIFVHTFSPCNGSLETTRCLT